MGKSDKHNAKKILQQYLHEPPSLSQRQKNQLNQGGEIKKNIKANGYEVEIRVTFQGWQVKIFNGVTLCAKSARQRPLG